MAMAISKAQEEPRMERVPSLDKTWIETGRVPDCPHDPPCKFPRWFRALTFLYTSLSWATYILGYEAHFLMVPAFASGVLSYVWSEHQTLLYWCSVLPFLVATLLSLRAFEHVFGLAELKVGNKSVPFKFFLFMKMVNPIVFTAISLVSGWSARIALVAVGISVLSGFATSAYKWENWQFRRSLGELVKGRIRGEFSRSPVLNDEELCKGEIQPDSTQSENKPQIQLFRLLPLLLLWRFFYSAYVHIAHTFRGHFPGPLHEISLLLSGASVWLPQVYFWAFAIDMSCTLILLVTFRGPIFCLGKSVDRNFLRLFVVVPPVVAFLIPGGWGDGWKGLVTWTLALMPCTVVATGSIALRVLLQPILLKACALVWLLSLFESVWS